MFENANISFTSLPYFLAACVYCILIVRLLINQQDVFTRRANWFLVALFAIFAWLEFDEFLVYVDKAYALPAPLEILMFCLHLLLGPLTYIYTSAMLRPDYLSVNILKHAVFFLVIYSVGIVFIVLMESERGTLVVSIIFLFTYLLSLLAYVIASIRKLNQYIGKSKNLFSNLDHHNLNWLRFWLAFMLFVALYVCINPFLKRIGIDIEALFEIHHALLLSGLVLLIWPNSADQKALHKSEGISSKETPTTGVVKQQYNDIFHAVEEQLQTHQVYLKQGLALKDLSTATGYSIEDISRAINQVGACCFYDLVNEYRIQTAMQMLQQHSAKAIIDIAMDCGFNSKSSFYNAFRKVLGQTPSDYRKQVA